MRLRFLKYTKEQFIKAVQENKSIRQVLLQLHVEPHGGNYEVARKYIKKLNLNTDHFTGMASNKGKKFNRERPIEEYLSNVYPIQSHRLKLRLLKEKYLEYKCYKCNLTTWNDKPIPLELEHKDGNHSNNNLGNLTLLCPNCHAQTSTYRGRNKGCNKSK